MYSTVAVIQYAWITALLGTLNSRTTCTITKGFSTISVLCRNMEKLWTMIQPTVTQHGSFRTRGELGRVRSQQKGSIRTNCIDCLDRTNVVQGMLGRKALEGLLRELLLLDVNEDLKSQFPQVCCTLLCCSCNCYVFCVWFTVCLFCLLWAKLCCFTFVCPVRLNYVGNAVRGHYCEGSLLFPLLFPLFMIPAAFGLPAVSQVAVMLNTS